MSKRVLKRTIKKESTCTCNKCGKSFTSTRGLNVHQKKNKNCDREYKCSKCQKLFKSEYDFNRHAQRTTSCVPEDIPVIVGDNIDNKCHVCNNTFSTKYNLLRHMQTCNFTMNALQLMKLAQASAGTTNVTNVTNNTLIQNNTVQVNLVVCNFGQEDLGRIDSERIKQLVMNHAGDFIPKMIETVHKNPELPEYRNVYYDPVQEKALIFTEVGDDTKTWKVEDVGVISAQLTQKIKKHVINNPRLDLTPNNTDSNSPEWITYAANMEEIFDTNPEDVEEANIQILATGADEIQAIIAAE